MVTALVTTVIILALLVVFLQAASVYRERRYQAVLSDLLDRVMARNYGEYAAATKMASPERARKRRFLSDEDLAEMERQARHEIGALTVAEKR